MGSLLRQSYDLAVQAGLRTMEANVIPDRALRPACRYLMSQRIAMSRKETVEEQLQDLVEFAESLKSMPIALSTAAANEQHYEVPTELFQLCLGKRLKYRAPNRALPDVPGEATQVQVGINARGSGEREPYPLIAGEREPYPLIAGEGDPVNLRLRADPAALRSRHLGWASLSGGLFRSCCCSPMAKTTLDEAEELMPAMYCKTRAGAPSRGLPSLPAAVMAGRAECALPSSAMYSPVCLPRSCCYFPTAKTTLDEAEELMLAIYCVRAQLVDGQDVMPPHFPVCCYFPSPKTTLDEAEELMLAMYCERAQLADGQDILELGCGWGSLSLYMGEKYPNSRIVGVSNSSTQRAYIEGQCKKRGINNVRIITADMNTFQAEGTFDRVVSVEMFEHMKNYQLLLKKVASWMKPEALLFIHIFTHKDFAYHFEDAGPDDWMTRYFFTGGTMPADKLLLYFQDDLSIANHWCLNGTHYQRTSEAWLHNFDANIVKLRPILAETYGKEAATKWTVYWRTFFIAVAELFGYSKGQEWIISHYLFQKKQA
ncbi:unnamed protein product [Closterium sp. NIES-65]|nr:unnamed protein product [Closterium sp. NIES-65]